MPPGPVYNWLAVAHSALVILDHALQYRAAQVTRGVLPSTRVSQSRQPGARGGAGGVFEKVRQQEVEVEVKDVVEETVPSRALADDPLSSEPTLVQQSSLLRANEAWLRQLEIAVTPRTSRSEMVPEQQLRCDTTVASMLLEPSSSSTTVPPGIAETRPPPAAEEPPIPAADVNLSRSDAPPSQHLQIPESDAPAVDVRTLSSNSLNSLKHRFYCRCLCRLGSNHHRDTFSLPKCLLLASGDFSTTEVCFYPFVLPIFFRARPGRLIVQLLRPRGIPRLWRSVRAPPPLDDIRRLDRFPFLAHDDRGKFDAPRIQAHADAWCSTESWAIPQHPGYLRPPPPVNLP